jgi:3'(2'), 5'-bisphosphate nucleotidase
MAGISEKWINVLLQAVYKASDEIMHVYNSDFSVDFKPDQSPVTIADKRSSEIILEYLKPTDLTIISEEEEIPNFDDRKKIRRLWLVDPLDGTSEFINRNNEFCICIAMITQGRANFGMIANPIDRTVIFGGPGFGAYMIPYGEADFLSEKFALQLVPPGERYGLVYSRSHFSPKVLGVVDAIQKKYGNLNVIKKGSALKFFDLVQNTVQFYPRFAPTMEWDIAAGQAIYEAIGGEVVDFINFKPLRYNKASLYNPYFIARPIGLKIS